MAVTNPVVDTAMQAAKRKRLEAPASSAPAEAAEGGEAPKEQHIAFNTLKAVQLPPQQAMRPAWAEPILAMQDVTFSRGRPVILKSCPKSTYHLLKNSLVNMRSNLALRMSIPSDISPKALQERLLRVSEELQQLPQKVPVTLQVFWNAETGGAQTISLATLLGGGKALAAKEEAAAAEADSDDEEESDGGEEAAASDGKAEMEQGILVLQEVLHKVHPESKLVVFTPASTLQGAKAQKVCEIFDAHTLGYKLDKDGFEHKVAKLHQECKLQAPLEAALRAVRDVPYKDLSTVFRDATLIASRHAAIAAPRQPDKAPELTAPQLLHVLMAGERLRNLGAGGTEEAQKHLVRVRGEEAALLAEAPKPVREFCELVRKFDAVRVLAPHVSRGLLIEGDKDHGKEGLARSIAASVGDGFLFAPDRTELLSMVIAGKGKGLGKFLTEVNTFAHQQKCRGVVYLADLADLLQTIDRVSEQGVLVRGVLAKLLRGFGTEPNRDRLVLVAAARDVEALGDELAQRFGTRAYVQSPSAAQRLQLWRSELTAVSNGALSDEALREHLLPVCTGFSRADVQQALALAAQHALAKGEAATPTLTVEDLLVGVRAQAQSQHQPAWLSAYS